MQFPAQLRDVVKAGIESLVATNNPPTLFVHAESLSVIDIKTQEARPLSSSQLKLAISDSANWFDLITTKRGEVEKAAYPRTDVVAAIHSAQGKWLGIPHLEGIADVPVITRASGLLTKPGYDADSGIYLLPGGYADVPPTPSNPTTAEINAALSLILNELLVDFPFADDASRANALALFLLPFVRDLIEGPTPLHHIDAPQEGTGKSLLAETWGWVSVGADIKSFSEPDGGDWQKLILAELMNAPRYIFIDNVNKILDSGNLASALTSPVISGRLLGFTQTVKADVRCVWISSGNNIRMSGEISRRTVSIRLDASKNDAHQGRTFRHSLPRWAKLNRGKLVGACLTLCQAWLASGYKPGRKLLGKYESWSAVMDGILSVAGITDLLGNDKDFRKEASSVIDEWAAFIPAWWDMFHGQRVGVRELHELAASRDAFGSLFESAKGEKSERTRLGKALGSMRDRTFGSLKLLKDSGTDKNGCNQYRLSNMSQSLLPEPDENGEGTL